MLKILTIVLLGLLLLSALGGLVHIGGMFVRAESQAHTGEGSQP